MWLAAVAAAFAVLGLTARQWFKQRKAFVLPVSRTIADHTTAAVDGQRIEIVGQIFATTTTTSPIFQISCVAARGSKISLNGNTNTVEISYVATPHFYIFDDSGMVKVTMPARAEFVMWRMKGPSTSASNVLTESETAIKVGDLLCISGIAAWSIDPHKPRHPRDTATYRDSPNRILQLTATGETDATAIIVDDDRALFGGLVATRNPKRLPKLAT